MIIPPETLLLVSAIVVIVPLAVTAVLIWMYYRLRKKLLKGQVGLIIIRQAKSSERTIAELVMLDHIEYEVLQNVLRDRQKLDSLSIVTQTAA